MKNYMLLVLLVSTLGSRPSFAQESGWIMLFDGKSMDGWKAPERPASWAFKDGALVTQGDRSHLFYVGDVANHNFKNFEFQAEVMTKPGSNSGIYVHTKYQDSGWPESGYELQVINSNPAGGTYAEHKMTGSIYAVRNTWKSPVKDNEWFEYKIVVSGKTIQTFINGKLTCEYTESEHPFRANDKKGRLLSSGTFALQAHDPGSVAQYRNIKVRLLPDDAKSLGAPTEDSELDALISQFSNDNFPLIDLGVVAASPAAQEAIDNDARKYGITLGSSLPIDALSKFGKSIVVMNDKNTSPSTEFLQSVKAAGAKIAFSSGGDTKIDPERLKKRLQAIKAAKLATQDFWIPGKE